MDFQGTPGAGDGAPGRGGPRGRRVALRQARVAGTRAPRGGATPAGGPTGGSAGWRSGDELAATITARCGTMVLALHGRQTPGTLRPIDHLLIAPTGVWVVVTDRHHGKVDIDHPPLARPRLTIGGADRTDLVDALDEQLDLVGAAMVRIDPRVAIRGALCMITPKGLLQDAGLPTLRPLEIHGHPVASPKRITRLLTADDAIVRLPALERTRTARALAQRFPAQRAR